MNYAFTVDVPPDQVWQTLWDIDAVARCIPGCERVTVIEPRKSYVAQVKKKVGPFALGMEMHVIVVEIRAPDLLRVEVQGDDRRLRSKVTQAISIALAPDGEHSTRVDISGQFTLVGLLGGLNQHLISGQVTQTLEDFSVALQSTIYARRSAASAGAGTDAAAPSNPPKTVG